MACRKLVACRNLLACRKLVAGRDLAAFEQLAAYRKHFVPDQYPNLQLAVPDIHFAKATEAELSLILLVLLALLSRFCNN